MQILIRHHVSSFSDCLEQLSKVFFALLFFGIRWSFLTCINRFPQLTSTHYQEMLVPHGFLQNLVSRPETETGLAFPKKQRSAQSSSVVRLHYYVQCISKSNTAVLVVLLEKQHSALLCHASQKAAESSAFSKSSTLQRSVMLLKKLQMQSLSSTLCSTVVIHCIAFQFCLNCSLKVHTAAEMSKVQRLQQLLELCDCKNHSQGCIRQTRA